MSSDFVHEKLCETIALRSTADIPVSVIIPHYNDLENLHNCLKLLAAQTLAQSDYEIVVADNNSQCGIDAVRTLCGGQAQVVAAPLQGAAEARNVAVRASRGAILAFIDSDCRPAPDWLDEGVNALINTDIVGGRVDVDYEDPDVPTGVEAFEKVFAFDFKKYVEKDNFSGSGNMFVRRATFDEVGDFRTGVSEDREWCNRAVAQRFRLIYANSVIVSHPARRNWPELAEKWRRIVSQTYLLNRERPLADLRWIAYCLVVLASPLVHSIKIAHSPKVPGAKLKCAAILVLFRIRWFSLRVAPRSWLRSPDNH